MYITTIEDETVPDNIIEALWTRDLCKGSVYMSAKEAEAQHFDMLVSFEDDPNERQKLIKTERALLESGNAYFAKGYRLHETDRQIRGLGFTIPDEALAWRLVSAGYIAGSEAERLQYVIK